MDSPKTQQLKGNWKQFKGRVQEAWGDLTDDELDQYEGRRKQLEGHIMERTGESREAVRERLDAITRDSRYNF